MTEAERGAYTRINGARYKKYKYEQQYDEAVFRYTTASPHRVRGGRKRDTTTRVEERVPKKVTLERWEEKEYVPREEHLQASESLLRERHRRVRNRQGQEQMERLAMAQNMVSGAKTEADIGENLDDDLRGASEVVKNDTKLAAKKWLTLKWQQTLEEYDGIVGCSAATLLGGGGPSPVPSSKTSTPQKKMTRSTQERKRLVPIPTKGYRLPTHDNSTTWDTGPTHTSPERPHTATTQKKQSRYLPQPAGNKLNPIRHQVTCAALYAHSVPRTTHLNQMNQCLPPPYVSKTPEPIEPPDLEDCDTESSVLGGIQLTATVPFSDVASSPFSSSGVERLQLQQMVSTAPGVEQLPPLQVTKHLMLNEVFRLTTSEHPVLQALSEVLHESTEVRSAPKHGSEVDEAEEGTSPPREQSAGDPEGAPSLPVSDEVPDTLVEDTAVRDEAKDEIPSPPPSPPAGTDIDHPEISDKDSYMDSVVSEEAAQKEDGDRVGDTREYPEDEVVEESIPGGEGETIQDDADAEEIQDEAEEVQESIKNEEAETPRQEPQESIPGDEVGETIQDGAEEVQEPIPEPEAETQQTHESGDEAIHEAERVQEPIQNKEPGLEREAQEPIQSEPRQPEVQVEKPAQHEEEGQTTHDLQEGETPFSARSYGGESFEVESKAEVLTASPRALKDDTLSQTYTAEFEDPQDGEGGDPVGGEPQEDSKKRRKSKDKKKKKKKKQQAEDEARRQSLVSQGSESCLQAEESGGESHQEGKKKKKKKKKKEM